MFFGLPREWAEKAKTVQNENGLTLERWLYAAGFSEEHRLDSPYRMRTAWSLGEDPTSHRGCEESRTEFRNGDFVIGNGSDHLWRVQDAWPDSKLFCLVLVSTSKYWRPGRTSCELKERYRIMDPTYWQKMFPLWMGRNELDLTAEPRGRDR
jgi:hypothetical protein